MEELQWSLRIVESRTRINGADVGQLPVFQCHSSGVLGFYGQR